MNLLITRREFVWYLINEDTGETLYSGESRDIFQYIQKLKVNNLKVEA